MTVNPLNTEELYLLKDLFSYNDPEKMIQSNSQKIESGEIDIFGLFSNKVLIGELRAMYSNSDERFAQKGKRAYLYAFRIHENHQGKGLGKHLLKYVIDNLTQNGYYEITVGVEDDNERAKHIYNSFGFDKIVSRIQEEYQGEKYEYNLYQKRK